MKILFKYPTRDRDLKFVRCLDRYYEFIEGNNYEFIISMDEDDNRMNNKEARSYLDSKENLSYYYSNNKKTHKQHIIDIFGHDAEKIDFSVRNNISNFEEI